MTTSENKSRNEHLKPFTVRKVYIKCINSIGQIGTFTKDENGKQNSPSFDSFYELVLWAKKPFNYSFYYDLKMSNNI